MISVKLNDILNAVPIFQEISKQNFKGAASFKIAKLIRELNKELTTFEETRQKLVNEYAAKDENGEIIVEDNMIKLPDENIEVYNAQMMETLNTMCEVNADKIPANCFDEIDMTPAQSYSIMEFID